MISETQTGFNKAQIELSCIGKAISHPARIFIIQEILSRGKCTTKELTMQLPYSQSTISQHIRALVDAGILIPEKSKRGYSLNLKQCIDSSKRVYEYFCLQNA